jgi:hypothetical protein
MKLNTQEQELKSKGTYNLSLIYIKKILFDIGNGEENGSLVCRGKNHRNLDLERAC